jgi:ABC-2 type transport system permease protein
MTEKGRNRASVFRNELKRVIDDHSILLTVIIAPLLYAFFLGSIYYKKDIDQIDFVVVDYDNSMTSRKLTQLLRANPKINVIGYLKNYQEAVEKLYKLEAKGFLVFPDGFEKDLFRLEGSNVALYLNTTRFLPSNDLNKAVNMVMATAGSGVRLKYFVANGKNPQQAMELINPVLADVRPIYNPLNSYGGFLLPGLFFLILQQTLLIGLGESVSRDKEKGILNNLLVEKGGIANYLFGKTAYYIFLYSAYIVLFMAVVFPFFEIPVAGAIIPSFTISLLFLLTIMLLAILIGSFVNSQIRIMEILAFTTYPFFLISGYSWPVSAMPEPIQWLSYLVPTTPMLEAMSKLFIMGGGWMDVLGPFRHLLVLFTLMYLSVLFRLEYLRKRKKAKIRLGTSLN